MQKQKSTPPWRSKLTPYQDEILTAWYQERATLKTIQSHLAKYGITITLSGISRFIRCRKNSTLFAALRRFSLIFSLFHAKSVQQRRRAFN